MVRPVRTSLIAAALAVPAFVMAQQAAAPKTMTMAPAAKTASKDAAAPKTAAAMTKAQKIADAMKAAPAAISRHATIMDWPATPDGQPTQLRAGTNGWACYPSMAPPVDDPMCMDQQWQAWVPAYMSKKTPPKPTRVGVAYMLMGDGGASNTDPFAVSGTPTNAWVVSPPHIMLLMPDAAALDAYPTDPKNGGPWVMWKGTPFAHIMVPVSATKAATVPVIK